MSLKSLIPSNIKTLIKMSDAYIITKISQILHPDFRCTADTKRCFYSKKSPHYKYEYFGKDTPVCCATHLYDILTDVTKVLEENDLEYFISFGTLLGAVRHGGLIPWDTDVDILIAEEKKREILDLLKDRFKDYSYEVVEDRDEGIIGSLLRVNFSKHNTLHIDLFTYHDRGESILFGYEREFSKKDIYPLKKIKFYDREVYAPKEIEQHLTSIYGKDHMKYAYRQWALNKRKFMLTEFKPAKIEN